MMTDVYLSIMKNNRSFQKNMSQYYNTKIENLQIYDCIFITLLDWSDKSGLKRQTKYIIKKLLDTYVLKYPSYTPDDLIFAGINFFRLAIKVYMTLTQFHENPSLYDRFTIEWCMSLISTRHTKEDFINFELEMFNEPEISMHFTTPDDYFGLYINTFSPNEQTINQINKLLDFSLTIPDLIYHTAEEIFFGCLLYVYEKKDIEKFWAHRQTFSLQRSLNASQIIKNIYQNQVEQASK